MTCFHTSGAPRITTPAKARRTGPAATPTGRIGAEHLIIGVCGRRLAYPEAAARFVAWLQAHDETGEQPKPRLQLLYARHCADEGLSELPDNKLFEAIGKAIGAYFDKVNAEGGVML